MIIKKGESKTINYIGNGLVEISLKPTVYSYTYNRNAEVPGSDKLRFEASKILCGVLKENGVKHSYQEFKESSIISDLVLEESFEIPDLSPNDLDKCIRFCPIEVVVKRTHVGTPKHRYYQMENYTTRAGKKITPGSTYPFLMVRFDWRNPNNDAEGNRLCDEVMTEEFANLYINVSQAKKTAIKAFTVLSEFLESKGLLLDDICFFIDQEGECIFSEVSPDCMRVSSIDEGSLDKDVWRAGGSSPLLLEKWQRFLDLIK